MPSSITWLDHDHAARERSLRILALFKEKESRDELGIGAIRDAIADRLFPGTSTIQTRLRYMLLVPWVYQALELRKTPSREISGRGRQEELRLVRSLLDAREEGVFGRVAGSGLKRLPSSVYWAGLGAWGIRRFGGSQGDYHLAVDRLYQRRALARRREDEDHDPDRASQTWHPRLPSAPKGFPDQVDLQVTTEEATFLVDRIQASCEGSLLAWLVLHGQPAAAPEIWQHPQVGDFPKPMRVLLAHGRRFADIAEGAARLYNLCLAELAMNDPLAEEHGAWLARWASDLDLADLRAWRPSEFWTEVTVPGHAITPRTRAFVEAWLARVLETAGRVAGDEAARRLVRQREERLNPGYSRRAA